MKALIIDDEPILLAAMKRIVTSAPEIESAEGFEYPGDALRWAQSHKFDIVFADIMMDEMKGTDLAQKLREIAPNCKIVFCTGYAQYAVEVINRGIGDGYLIKPVSSDDIRETIRRFTSQQSNVLLTCKNKPGGPVLYDKYGDLLVFRHKKTMQLFSILLERGGERITTDELCERMWEHHSDMILKNRQYLYSLSAELKTVLAEHGAAELFNKNGDGYSLDITAISIE